MKGRESGSIAVWRGADETTNIKTYHILILLYTRRPLDGCSPGRGGMAQDGGTRGGTFHGAKWIAAAEARAGLGMQPYART